MTRAPSPRPASRTATLAFAAWVLAWLVALGGLAADAWLARPLPTGLPAIGGTATGPKALCVVVIDGLREQALWDDPSAMPWLREFSAGGAGGVALAGDPTLTAACVRALLTGRKPDLKIALQNFAAPPVEGSWLQALRALGARAAHGGDAGIAQMCAPWLDPADVLAFLDRGPVDQGECDAQAQPFVLERARRGYEALTLHLTRPDHAGHKHGALGAEYRAACAGADAHAREVVEAFLANHADGTVLVATDHGVSAAGTHGGGEPAARRAPFVLRGPGVARGLGLEVDQSALAPTLAALLGLPQPPLADAPPDVRLLALPAAEVQRALDAHVQARLWVARTTGAEGVGAIERTRAEVAVARLGAAGEAALRRMSDEVDRLLRPEGLWLRLGVLAFALLGILVFVRVPPDLPAERATGFGTPVALVSGVLAFAAGLALPTVSPHGSLIAAALTTLGLLAVRVSARSPAGHVPGPDAGVVLAALIAVPLATAAGVALNGASARAAALAVAVPLALLAAFAVRAALRRPRLPRLRPGAPQTLVVLAGAALGLLLSLRPLVDPFVPLHTVLAVATCVTFAFVWRAGAARLALPAALAVPVLGALLLLPYLGADAANPAGWSQAPPWHVSAWATAGLAAALAMLLALPPGWSGRADRVHVGLALGAFALAVLERTLDPAGRPTLVRVALGFGPQVLAVAAFAFALRARSPAGPSPAGRLAARLTAALAFARRLTASDAEFAIVALLGLLCALAASRPLPATRRGLAGLAVLVLIVRTAAFHASGSVESFTMVDVGRGFQGLEEFVTAGAAVTPGEHGLTWPVVVATVQVGLRFAVPWLLLFAAVAYAARASALLRTVVSDVVLAFAARGAVLVLALWSLADNAWWVERAKDVFTLGAGDLLLLIAAGAAVGSTEPGSEFRSSAESPRGRPARLETSPI